MPFKARYSGKCGYCGRYFTSGTLIEKHGRWDYRPVNCQGCVKRKAALEVQWRMETLMLEKYNICYGYAGLQGPAGATGTHSPGDFIETCYRHGEITTEERKLLYGYWGSTAQKDLAD